MSSHAPSTSEASHACTETSSIQKGFDLRAALRKAKAIGSTILGVVLRNEGLGLRTKECDFERVDGQIHTAEEARRFIGDRWEVTNLLLSWSKAAFGWS